MDNPELDLLIEKAANLILASKNWSFSPGRGQHRVRHSGLRSPGGVWEKYDSSLFTLDNFLSSPEIRRTQWQIMLEGGWRPGPAQSRPPRPGRVIPAGKTGLRNYSEVDFLHQQGGVPDDRSLRSTAPCARPVVSSAAAAIH